MMNNQDVLTQPILQPDPRLSFRLDGHWLRVNSSKEGPTLLVEARAEEEDDESDEEIVTGADVFSEG